MTRSRTFARQSIAVIVAAVIMMAAIFPSSPAMAEEPPFELVFPQEPDKTTLHDDFGAGRSSGRSHRGNDLMAPKLTRVYAAASGFVETVATSSRAGRYVVIRHSGGWTSTYIHLNNDSAGTDDGSAPWSLTVAHGVYEGAYVRAGQLIGFVGDSGNAEWTSSHTHFELALDGRNVNPYRLLHEAWVRDYEILMLRAFYQDNEEKFSIV